MNYKHRLIFDEREEAEQAEKVVTLVLADNLDEVEGVNDASDERPTYELVFTTGRKVLGFDLQAIVQQTTYNYSFNEEI